MLINKENTDILIIDRNGEVVFDDIGNYHYFELGTKSVRGKNIKRLFVNIGDEYPLFKVMNTGKAILDFHCKVTTERGISVEKMGDAYPMYDGDKIIGAVEFAHFFYEKDYIGEIEHHADHVMYRKNNTKYILDDIITADEKMLMIKSEIDRLAITDSNVLIYGETGTGKELIAQSIHNSSRRYNKQFVSQNCGAIPANLLEGLLFGTTKGSFTGAVERRGLFEIVDGGTIFLDEINSLDPNLQVKLLNVLEKKTVRRIGSNKEKKLDFRVIAATNENPKKLLKEGKMKPDLFYRLAVMYIHLPKLVERKGDIELLTKWFIGYFNEMTNSSIEYLDDDILQIFKNYSWPGNVRELRNVIEGAFAFATDGKIKKEDIPKYIIEESMREKKSGVTCNGNLIEDVAFLEKNIIMTAYALNHNNLGQTAKQLGISSQLLKYKLDKYKGAY